MSINISIGLGDDNVSATALDQHMAALGFTRGVAFVRTDEPGPRTVASAEPEPRGADPTVAAAAEVPGAKPRGRPRKDTPVPAANISANPEDRKPPEETVETAAEAEQDAADEAAEVEAARDPKKPLTTEDLRNAMGLYVAAFDLAAAQQDGTNIFTDALGAPPAGSAGWKLTTVTEAGQEHLRKAIDAWKDAAAAGKRYGS